MLPTRCCCDLRGRLYIYAVKRMSDGALCMCLTEGIAHPTCPLDKLRTMCLVDADHFRNLYNQLHEFKLLGSIGVTDQLKSYLYPMPDKGNDSSSI
jgi:hypothetical protein